MSKLHGQYLFVSPVGESQEVICSWSEGRGRALVRHYAILSLLPVVKSQRSSIIILIKKYVAEQTNAFGKTKLFQGDDGWTALTEDAERSQSGCPHLR
ncbi:hypothetical protein RUM43_011134 [Polyplax serrata]|uniref:Uncharacterized protein n=1 Tax=Polyplax serrata TaxID=468196 RepID=A0AAN8RTD8_POLSC